MEWNLLIWSSIQKAINNFSPSIHAHLFPFLRRSRSQQNRSNPKKRGTEYGEDAVSFVYLPLPPPFALRAFPALVLMAFFVKEKVRTCSHLGSGYECVDCKISECWNFVVIHNIRFIDYGNGVKTIKANELSWTFFADKRMKGKTDSMGRETLLKLQSR